MSSDVGFLVRKAQKAFGGHTCNKGADSRQKGGGREKSEGTGKERKGKNLFHKRTSWVRH